MTATDPRSLAVAASAVSTSKNSAPEGRIMIDDVALRKALVAGLMTAGKVGDSSIRAAFAKVPRHCFAPSFFVEVADGLWRAVDSTYPDYYALVYADTALTTQLVGGIDPGPGIGDIYGADTSGSDRPGLMAVMLEALNLSGRETVLEIGTGTGYNAALLSHRLGPKRVTSVEIDPVVAELARRRLAVCGYDPTVVTGDGESGWRLGAPYRRVIATCAVPWIPSAWVDQTGNGGLIVAGLWRGLGGGPLVRLRVDSGVARGRFLPYAGDLMPTRSVTPIMPALTVAVRQKSEIRDATLDSAAVNDPHAGMFLALQMPGVARLGLTPARGETEQLWLFAADGSWSRLDDTTMTVEQHGPRWLWDEMETAHLYWRGLESPTRDRIGLTVSRNGTHHFWLDTPSRQLWATGTKKNR